MKFEELFELESKRLIDKYPKTPSSHFEAMGILNQKHFDLMEMQKHGKFENPAMSKEFALAFVHFAFLAKRAFDFHSIAKEEYDSYVEFSK